MKSFPHFLLSAFILLAIADGLLAERLDAQSSVELPADLVDANGETRSTNFKDKFIGLYFFSQLVWTLSAIHSTACFFQKQ